MREKGNIFFLKALGIWSTGIHVSGVIILKMRMFLNPSLLWEYAAWYFCSEQRSYLANEPNYPKGLCLSHFCNTERSKTPQTHTAVCAAELISGGPLRCRLPGVPQCPWVAFFLTSGVFHALSSQRMCLLVLSYPGKAARLESKAEIQTFAAPPLFYYAMFSLPPVRRLLFSLWKRSSRGKKSPPCKSQTIVNNDNSQPPVTPIGNKSVTCVVGRIFPGELRNFGLDTKVSHHGNFKSWDIRGCLKKS